MFRVRIPLAPVAADRQDKTARSHPVSTLAGLHMLVVEDEMDAREMVSLLLRDAGATVTGVGSAAEALKFIETQTANMVISDLGLPEIDGLRFMQTLRAKEAPGARMPAIALTAYTRAQDRASILNAGYDAHVPKPVNASELLAVIQSLIHRVQQR